MKEIFIFALLFMIIMFTLVVLLYEFIPVSSWGVEPVEYSSSSEVETIKQEIGSIYTVSTEDMFPDWSYNITKSDLKELHENNAYQSGKLNPFEDDYIYKFIIFNEKGELSKYIDKNGIVRIYNADEGRLLPTKDEKGNVIGLYAEYARPLDLLLEEQLGTNLQDGGNSSLNSNGYSGNSSNSK